ncbi:hypothetical protein [Pseudomonas sp. SED1]|uniref:hypothetical protein n=1 Tax=Pseudomonas sp. SED1 TaxID=3056845 RepID=UPI00296E48B8|nr:hypothetical protein [Pseudomonas sp. SED1]MDY0833565.1 hypothetical protein [Pseudomonas sp. SED1]
MSKRFITTWFYASLETKKVSSGILGMSTKDVYDPRTVNVKEMAKQLEDVYNEYDAEGYDVVNILPVSLGTSEASIASNGNYLGDVGFSINRGAIVVGKRRD